MIFRGINASGAGEDEALSDERLVEGVGAVGVAELGEGVRLPQVRADLVQLAAQAIEPRRQLLLEVRDDGLGDRAAPGLK